MSRPTDWLSQLLDMVPVSGRVDIRCYLGAPWRVEYGAAPAGEIAYHIILAGTAVLEGKGAAPRVLTAGDIVLLSDGSDHFLHDGGGAPPMPNRYREAPAVTVSENDGPGERLDMLCGRFVFSPAHERLMRSYLPAQLVVSAAEDGGDARRESAAQLSGLVSLLRLEASEDLGAKVMLRALSTAMFALILRLASESAEPPAGLLALAGQPRLAPALSALFNEPGRPWSLPELAGLCNMSRATFVRHFQDRMGRSASDMLSEIRMTAAANELARSEASTGTIAEAVGYRSEAAFQRAFKQYMGVTPAHWRRRAHSASASSDDARRGPDRRG